MVPAVLCLLAVATAPPLPVSLEDGWAVHVEAATDTASSARSWTPVGRLDGFAPEPRAEVVWFRTQVRLPVDTPLAAIAGNVRARYDVFVDGAPAIVDHDPGPAIVPIPAAGTATRTITLRTVRAPAHARFGGTWFYGGPWVVARPETVPQLLEVTRLKLERPRVYSAVLTLLTLVAAIYLFALARRRPELPAYRYLGWTVLFISVWSLPAVLGLFGEVPDEVALRVAMSAAKFANACGLQALWTHLVGTRVPRWVRALQGVNLLVGAAVLLGGFSAFWLVRPPTNEVVALGAVAVALGIIVVQSVRGRRAARIVGLGLVPYTSIILLQLASQAGMVAPPPTWLMAITPVFVLVGLGLSVDDEYRATLRRIRSTAVESAPLPLDTLAVPSGTRLGRYVVGDKLGEGGMGVVYRAHDPDLARDLAIKLIRPQAGAAKDGPDPQQSLLEEAQAMAKVVHANLVTIFDVGTHGGQVFIAMELVVGDTLQDWLTTEPPAHERLAALRAAGEGLEALHRGGLVHRDFKLANVMRTADGRVLLMDFGLVRSAPLPVPGDASPEVLQQTAFGVGSPAYMAPEQFRGFRATSATDQFSFCVALYQAMYGVHPFLQGTDLTAMKRALFRQRFAPPRQEVPDEALASVVRRGLSVPVDARFASMRSLLDRLPTRLEG